MPPMAVPPETEARRSAMLQTAFCPVVREALAATDTLEIMANPDGSVWIEKAGIGIVQSSHILAAVLGRDTPEGVRRVNPVAS